MGRKSEPLQTGHFGPSGPEKGNFYGDVYPNLTSWTTMSRIKVPFVEENMCENIFVSSYLSARPTCMFRTFER